MKEMNFLAEMADQFPVVSADHNRRSLLVDLFEEADDFKGELGIEISRRFIGQDNRRVVDDGASDGHSLLLAVRERGRIFPDFGMEVDHPQGIKHLPAELFASQAENLEGDGHIVENFFMKEKAEILEDNADLSPQYVDFMVGYAQDIFSGDYDLALGRQDFPENGLE